MKISSKLRAGKDWNGVHISWILRHICLSKCGAFGISKIRKVHKVCWWNSKDCRTPSKWLLKWKSINISRTIPLYTQLHYTLIYSTFWFSGCTNKQQKCMTKNSPKSKHWLLKIILQLISAGGYPLVSSKAKERGEKHQFQWYDAVCVCTGITWSV